jgi:hypothetical protein
VGKTVLSSSVSMGVALSKRETCPNAGGALAAAITEAAPLARPRDPGRQT